MRILLLNQDWFKTELQELGHEVISCGFQPSLDVHLTHTLLHIDSVLRLLPDGFLPDVIIWLDNSAPILYTGLEECDIPLIFYSVDTHHHAELHSLTGHIFDKMFVAQRDYMPQVEEYGLRPEWLPLWASRWVDPTPEKKWKSSFVGNLNPKLNPERVRFFDELKALTDIHIAHGAYWTVFPHSEIVVNQTVKGDLNFRVFEAMMCGTTLLTENAGNGLLELFKDGEHLVIYEKNNSAQAAGLIESLNADLSRCRRIAAQGREEILAKHLPQHRALTIDGAARSVKRTPNKLRFLGAMCNYGGLSVSLERNGSSPGPALVAALKGASQALGLGEAPGSHHLFYLVTSALRYDRCLGSTAGRDLLNQYAEAFPTSSLLQYMKIRNYLNSGRRDDAVRLAQELFVESPDITFAKAEECALSMLDAIMG